MAAPIIATTVDEARQLIATARAQGKKLALVPTMGALHAGHVSLIRAARAEASFVVVSIFVNPTQFGPHEDLSAYPRTLDADFQICDADGADVVFHPDADEIYPTPPCTTVHV